MNTHAIVVSFALALSIPTFSLAAYAAPVPLSAIPLGAETPPSARGTERVTDVRQGDGHFITALDRPVCIRTFDPKTASTEDFAPGGIAFGDATFDALEIDRLTPGDDPFLERIIVESTSDLSAAKVLRRVRLPLTEIAGAPLPVYAYRTAKAVYLLVPRGFEFASDAFDVRGGIREECGFVQMRLAVSGGIAQTLVLPARPLSEAERWIDDASAAWEMFNKQFPLGRSLPPPLFELHASLSKVSQDPEALLSVVILPPKTANGVTP